MDFAKAIKEESRKTFTENGATAYNTTSNALVDLFATIGSLRMADDKRIKSLFDEAYKEDNLLATKCLFYARDIREGLGERETIRKLLKYVANNHQEALRKNIALIGEYGRWDDLYELVGTPLEEDMWKVINFRWQTDNINMHIGNRDGVSLLAKWLKSTNTSSRESAKLGMLTANKLNLTVAKYRKTLSKLRRYLKVVERQMSDNNWNEINYSGIPSKAAMKYRKAFQLHDNERYTEYLESLKKGEAKINASALFPYDIVEKYIRNSMRSRIQEDTVLEEQWKALPDYVNDEANAIVMADTSGSMTCDEGRPLHSALALALYFAERNKGAYHGLWMSFSESPRINRVKGDSLAQKLSNIDYSGWGFNTNLKAAFKRILQIAIDNEVPKEEMVKSLIVISDMEIDHCVSREWSFYDHMRNEFAKHGYKIPNIVFWNVNSRHDVFHADSHRKGVQLCSGQSASTFKVLMSSVGLNPYQTMLKTLNSDRYSAVSIA